ncbi:MAG: HAMP domain-containing protein, partial [Pseudomonadota bacterium]
MVAELIRRLANSLLLMAALFLFLIATLYFVANTGEHLDSFGQSYQWWMLGTAVALVLIGVLIVASVWRLIADLRNNVSGSRLSLKLVTMLVVMALLPMTLVYSFSIKFLGSNIDSWFDVEVERALDDALALSRESLELHMRTRQKNTVEIAHALTDIAPGMAVVVLNDLGGDSDASELTLIGADNRVVATTAFLDTVTVVPQRPANDIIARARNGNNYVTLDPANDGGLQVRSVVPVYSSEPSRGVSVLYATYPVSRSSTQLADNVQDSFRNYRQLAYLRAPLKRSSIATLTLAVFLSLMMAVWVAFYAARRLMVPVHDLVDGTRMVAAGDYSTRLETSGRDELGYLVQSFNDMTDKIEAARASAASSRQQVEAQRAYLELVLSRVSTGVIALDEEGRVRTCNDSAANILRTDAQQLQQIDGSELGAHSLYIQQFFNTVKPLLDGPKSDWSKEFELVDEHGRRLLMCRGAEMKAGADNPAGHVLVFDDISDVVEAQRNAAWSEVARRLAHEIKNPLTPIQLSAERLQHKYAQKLQGDDAFTLKKLTNTIVHQVESMKGMVKAFAEYANTPEMDYQSVNLNDLVTETSWLYRHGDNEFIALVLDSELPAITGDPTRLRQVLHNIIKNALEATGGSATGKLGISTREATIKDIGYAELVFEPTATETPVPEQLPDFVSR